MLHINVVFLHLQKVHRKMTLFKNIAILIISPKVGWEEINKSGVSTQTALARGFYPLLALLALTAFVPMLYDCTIELKDALMQAIIQFSSFFFSYFICAYLVEGFFPELNKTHSANSRLNDFIVYNLIFLVLLAIMNNVLPARFPVLSLLVLYVVFMAYKGMDYLGLKQDRTTVFLITSSAMFLLVPAVLRCVLELIIV